MHSEPATDKIHPSVIVGRILLKYLWKASFSSHETFVVALFGYLYPLYGFCDVKVGRLDLKLCHFSVLKTHRKNDPSAEKVHFGPENIEIREGA